MQAQRHRRRAEKTANCNMRKKFSKRPIHQEPRPPFHYKRFSDYTLNPSASMSRTRRQIMPQSFPQTTSLTSLGATSVVSSLISPNLSSAKSYEFNSISSQVNATLPFLCMPVKLLNPLLLTQLPCLVVLSPSVITVPSFVATVGVSEILLSEKSPSGERTRRTGCRGCTALGRSNPFLLRGRRGRRDLRRWKSKYSSCR